MPGGYARVHAEPQASRPPLETIDALAALGGAVNGRVQDRDLVILEVGNERLLRVAGELADEFGLRVAVRGGDNEYRQL